MWVRVIEDHANVSQGQRKLQNVRVSEEFELKRCQDIKFQLYLVKHKGHNNKVSFQ